ncbi:MAG: glycosyltransferase family 2 protein [Actinobacteria bacterium]|nr:glycosyltransferase family 2 protein [Actinomycetota bacterium]
MNNKNILIIIASYNNENTIEMAIESCLQQTYKNIKIAMIDDASKDNTYNIMKKYYNENKDKIFLFQNKKNIGKYLSDNKVLSNIKNNNLYKFDY